VRFFRSRAGATAGSDDDGGASATADALAGIDLSTPLRDDEHLPTHEHRKAGAGKAGRGRGRARVLGQPEPAAAPAPAPAEAADGKKKKKSKKAAAEEEEAEAAAAAAAAAKPKKKKKAAADAADAAEAPAASSGKKASKASAEPPVKQGEEFAAAPPRFAALAGDKVARLTYSVVAAPASEPPTLLVTFRIEPRSSKKAIETIDVVFAAGAPVAPKSGTAGSPIRLAAGMKERAKGKDRTVSATISLLASADPSVPVVCPVSVVYKATGAPVTLEGRVVLSTASALVPVVMEPEVCVTECGARFFHVCHGWWRFKPRIHPPHNYHGPVLPAGVPRSHDV
jgi:hypothetical protein